MEIDWRQKIKINIHCYFMELSKLYIKKILKKILFEGAFIKLIIIKNL